MQTEVVVPPVTVAGVPDAGTFGGKDRVCALFPLPLSLSTSSVANQVNVPLHTRAHARQSINENTVDRRIVVQTEVSQVVLVVGADFDL